MRKQPASAMAHQFMVWRVGQSVDWRCSQEEIANEVGLTQSAVSNICTKRGWVCHYEGDLGGGSRTPGYGLAVDHATTSKRAQSILWPDND